MLLYNYKGVVGSPLYITSASDFIAFSNAVLAGTNYAGATVFLANDIDFSGSSSQFKPIGNSSNYFRGVLDGQGHKISNLVFNSDSFRHAGLFGYSMGLTIRNVVLDSTCSFSSSATTTGEKNAFVGGLIGCCDALDGVCISENIVNMASVTFSGTSGGNMFLGGISGQFYCEGDYEITVRNCINYGTVTFSGTSTKFGQIGGIVGELSESEESSTPKTKYVQNCINYGAIKSSGTSRDSISFIGGIVGLSYEPTKVENCVSAGKITLSSSLVTGYTGSILGFAKTDTHLLNCHWTDGTGYDKLYGKKEFGSVTVTSTGSSKISDYSEAVSALNSYNTAWNRWAYNTNSAPITFNINKGTGFTFTSSKLILLPSLAESSELTFSGWYTDSFCTSTFTSTTISTSGSMSLHGGWVYTLTYSGNGGTPSQPSKSVVYGQLYGTLSGATRDGYTFLGWYTDITEGNKVETTINVTNANNHTLYAHWSINNYTVTFNISKTTIIEEEYQFNETIEYPTNIPEIEGYMFVGWDKNITAMPEYNIIINAVWSKVTKYVEVVFGAKDLTENEVKDVVKQYTNSDFKIVAFENKSEGIKVIIKFANEEDAEEFVEKINKSIGNGIIKEVKFAFGNDSFSTMIYPLPFFNTLFL